MKAIIEFNLPEDESEYKITNNAQLYYNSLWNIKEKIRGVLKHGAPQNDYDLVLESIREMIPYEALE